MLKILHVLLFFTLVITIIKGIRYNICQNETGKRSMSCDNIYIWGNQKEEFTNAFNISFSQTSLYNFTELDRMKTTVRVIVHNMAPYVKVNNYTNDVEGFLGSLWKIVQRTLNFKCIVKSIDYYDTGLEIIQKGEADIFLAAVVGKKGIQNVTYSQPYFYNWYHLYLKSPEAKPTSSSYLKTLNEGLWLASILMFSTLAVSLWFVTRIINKTKIYNERNVSIFSCFLTVTSGFLNQGHDIHLKRNPCRIIIIFSLLLGLLLYAAMNAVLVAKLAIFDVQLPFDSLEDLRTTRSYSVCVRTTSFVYNNFTFANKTVRPEWQYVINGPGCLDINRQENLAKILCNNNVVILENRVVIGSVVRNYNITCQLTYLRKKYFENTNSFLFSTNFKWTKLVNTYLKMIRSRGVMNRLSKEYIQTELLDNYEPIKAPQVSIQHIDGILFIYVVTIFISLLILLAEVLYQKYFINSTFAYVN